MLKKLLLTAVIISCASSLFAQKYMTRTGKIVFDATAPSSVKKIEAINNEVGAIVDVPSGSLVFQVPINSFKFQNAKMQEDFNRDYMESGKYPRSEFKGTISNLKEINFSKDGTYKATAVGKITIHNVTKDITVPGTIEVSGKSIKLKAKFSANLKEYNINIPSLVEDKVGKVAQVTIDCGLKGM
jgi:hypothetical protein